VVKEDDLFRQMRDLIYTALGQIGASANGGGGGGANAARRV
jgi:hypothetical protein